MPLLTKTAYEKSTWSLEPFRQGVSNLRFCKKKKRPLAALLVIPGIGSISMAIGKKLHVFRPISRSFPPISGYDRIKIINGQIVSSRPQRNCFADKEILYINSLHAPRTIDDVPLAFTSTGRSLIQQQTQTGCTAAASAMLGYDLTQRLLSERIKGRTTSPFNAVDSDLLSLDLIPIHKTGVKTLKHLKKGLKTDGPAIAEIEDPAVNGHVIIIDRVFKRFAEIRDPYHGWSIIVAVDALLSRLTGNLIQARKP